MRVQVHICCQNPFLIRVCCSIILHRQFVGQFIGPTEAGISGFVRVTFHRGYSFHWRPCRQRPPIMPTQPCRFSVERTCRLLENQERPSHSKKGSSSSTVHSYPPTPPPPPPPTSSSPPSSIKSEEYFGRSKQKPQVSEFILAPHSSQHVERLKTVQFLSVPLQRYGTTNRRIQIHSLCRASHSHRYPRPLMRLLPQIQCLHLLLSVRINSMSASYWFSTIGRPSTQSHSLRARLRSIEPKNDWLAWTRASGSQSP